MTTYAIDFETTYAKDRDIKTLGNHHYLNHPDTEVYMVSIVGSDGFEWCGHPAKAPWRKLAGSVWISHNAAFDEAVYKTLETQRYVRPSEWHCTANLSVYLGAPRSLEKAAIQLLGVKPSKGIRDWMKGRTWEDAVHAGRDEELKEYALEDSRLCLQLWEKYSHLQPDHEKKLSIITRRISEHGIHMDRDMLVEGVQSLQKIRQEAEAAIPWEAPILSHKKLALECRKVGITPPKSLAQDSEECAAWEDEHGDKYPWVDAMRRFRKSNSMLRKVEKLRQRLREDDRVCTPVKYFGAIQTGRWSGDAGFNFQNMYRGEHFGLNLRNCFTPRAGKKFIICDLSQIEPRVLAWLVGDEQMLALLRQGVDIYEAHARLTMGYDDPRPLKEVDPEMRTLSKIRVLSLGYGCGHAKLKASAAQPPYNLEMTEAESRKVVSDFRTSNEKITDLWKFLDRQFKLSARKKETYEVELPSGRTIRYFEPSGNGDWTAKAEMGGSRRKYYGAMLTENLVQATARDVFSEGMIRVFNDPRFKIVLHVHDELVVEADHDVPADELRKLMAQAPTWMEGLPVEADAKDAERYNK